MTEGLVTSENALATVRVRCKILGGRRHGAYSGGVSRAHTQGGVLHAVHKVCTGPYPDCIVVPSTNNNEPYGAFI